MQGSNWQAQFRGRAIPELPDRIQLYGFDDYDEAAAVEWWLIDRLKPSGNRMPGHSIKTRLLTPELLKECDDILADFDPALVRA